MKSKHVSYFHLHLKLSKEGNRTTLKNNCQVPRSGQGIKKMFTKRFLCVMNYNPLRIGIANISRNFKCGTINNNFYQ